MRVIRGILLLAGPVLFVCLVIRPGLLQIIGVLRPLGWRFLLMLLLYGAHQLARSRVLEMPIGIKQSSYWSVLWIRISGEALQVFPVTGPLLVEPTKALLLKNRGTEGEIACLVSHG
jgi:hypothetical protein